MQYFLYFLIHLVTFLKTMMVMQLLIFQNPIYYSHSLNYLSIINKSMPNAQFEPSPNKHPSQINAQFCYLLIKDISSASLFGLYGVSVLVLSVLAIKQYKCYTYQQLQNRILKVVYYFLFLWSLIAGMEIILAEGFYLWAVLGANQEEINFNTLSKYVFLLTFIILFLFQTALLLSIYFWLKSVILFCSHSKEIISDHIQTIITQKIQGRFISSQNTLGLQIRITKMIKFYFLVRIVFLVLWSPFYCLYNSIQMVRFLALIFLYFMLVDSLVCFAFLILSRVAMKNKRLQLKKIYFKISKSIKLMMFPTFFRISMIIMNILSPYFDLSIGQQNCEILNYFQFYPYGLLALGGIGIYVFPYIMFLRALHPSSNLSSNSLAERQSDKTSIFLTK